MKKSPGGSEPLGLWVNVAEWCEHCAGCQT